MKKLVTVKDLIKAGFERRKDLDFEDDGNRFKGFIYKTLPLSYLKVDGYYYASLRIDYVKDLLYHDYNKKDWYILSDEFNGCYEVDVDKLVENAETILAGIKELKKEIANHIVDKKRIELQVKKEYKIIMDFIEEYSHININVTLDVDFYKIKTMASYIKQLKEDANYKLNNVLKADEKTLRDYEHTLNNYNYIIDTSDNCYYIKYIKEATRELYK